ncbi:iron-containing alcohol dehydrogenase [Bacillus sp. FSL H8-0547]
MNTFRSPSIIITGEGSFQKVIELVQQHQAEKVHLFADPVLIRLNVLKPLAEAFEEKKIELEIFSDIQPEPTAAAGNRAKAALADSGADLVIGIGGGSCLDLAKAAAVLSSHEGAVEDYLNLTGTKSLSNKGLPKLLIPTTSGTGAEMTDIAVFSLEDSKDVITHPNLLADAVIIDPELTYSLPPRATASSGIDALTHAIESYLSVHADVLTDTLALEAAGKIAASLRKAVLNGSDQEARNSMSWGSMLAGLSFFNAGVAGVHALAYPLGGLFKMPHGESNAVLLPYVMDEIRDSCSGKMAILARRLGIEKNGRTDEELARLAVLEMKHLIQDTGLPLSLREYGIKEEDLDRLADNGAKQTRLLSRSPKPLSRDDIKRIYTAAFHGNLKAAGVSGDVSYSD